MSWSTSQDFDYGTDSFDIGKQVRDTTVLPHVQAGKIVNDHHVRAKLHACVSALRDIGHRIRVKTNLLTPSHRGYSAQNH